MKHGLDGSLTWAKTTAERATQVGASGDHSLSGTRSRNGPTVPTASQGFRLVPVERLFAHCAAGDSSGQMG